MAAITTSKARSRAKRAWWTSVKLATCSKTHDGNGKTARALAIPHSPIASSTAGEREITQEIRKTIDDFCTDLYMPSPLAALTRYLPAAMAEYDEEATLAILHRETAANVQSDNSTVDKTYIGEWNRYKKWVKQKREAKVLPDGPKFLTRVGVDLYFQQEVARRYSVMPATARRAVSALQKLADKVEYIDGKELFHVESNFVKKALEAQVRAHVNYMLSKLGDDPHANVPTNIISKAECKKVLLFIWRTNVRNWQDFAVSWNVCMQTYMRNDSCRKLKLPDIKLDVSHGPARADDPDVQERMLSFILRPGIHKDTKRVSSKIKVVGCYRHIDLLQCATGSIAMSLFWRLASCHDLMFTKDGPNSWRNFPLLSWKSQSATHDAYKAVLNAVEVAWAKVTHLRLAAMEQTSSEGEIKPDEQATLSKHVTEKLFVYVTELYQPLLKVQAGFKRSDSYFVPRTLVELPVDIFGEDPTEIVFPSINTWRIQQRDPVYGDDSTAATDFLYNTLPFLARVVIQDGIYWVNDKDMISHEYVQLLRARMPARYEQWAREQREWVRQLQEQQAIQAAGVQGEGSQAAFNFLSMQMKTLVKLMKENGARMDRLEAQRVAPITRIGAPAAPSARKVSAIAPQVTPSPALNAILHPTPVVPVIGTFPKSMSLLLHEHVNVWKLDRFEGKQHRAHWPLSTNQAFSKRMYLYKRLKARADRKRNVESVNLVNAARDMDKEWKGMRLKSLAAYLAHLKKHDPSVKKRKPRSSNEAGS